MKKRIGPWMQTFSGRAFYPFDPRPEDIGSEDIAHSLAQQCRYNGHTRSFYSVAQHSVLVSHHVPAEDALWGLLHDAHEAYLGDTIRPIKGFLGFVLGGDMFVPVKALEKSIQSAICQAYGLGLEEPASVKRIDTAIIANEMRDLMAPPPEPWDLPEPAIPGLVITSWSPEQAEEMFLRRFHELRGAR